MKPGSTRPSRQAGRFVSGFLTGLLVGLAAALAVAVYVTKTPVPFVDKLPQRTPEQDAAEAARNRNWDPNAALSGKGSRPPAAPASGAVGPSGSPAAKAAARAATSASGVVTPVPAASAPATNWRPSTA